MINFVVCCAPGTRKSRGRATQASTALRILRRTSTDAALSFVRSTSAVNNEGRVLDLLLQNAPDVSSAEKIISAHPNPSAISYTTLMQAYIRSHDLSGAEAAFSRMKSSEINPDVVAYNVLMSAYAKRADYPSATDVFQKLKAEGLKPDAVTYNTLMRAAKNSDVAAVWRCFNLMLEDGVAPTEVTFSTLIDAIGRTGDTGTLTEIPAMMEKHNVKPNVFTYTALMTIYSRSGEVGKVRSRFNRMRETGVKPNVVAYGILLDTLVKARAFDDAEAAFQEMIEAEISVNETILTMMMRLRSDRGDIAGVKELFDLLGNPGLFRFNVLIHSLGMNGDIPQATQVFRSMQEQGVRPDVVTFNTLMKMRAMTGDLEGVKTYHQAMIDASLEPDGFSRAILIDALGDADNVQAAMEVQLLPDDEFARRILLRITSEHGDVEATKRVLQESPNRTAADELMLLRAYAKSNDWVRAEELYASLKPMTIHSVLAYTKVLGEYGKVETIRTIMEEALAAKIRPTEELLTTLIDAYANSGNLGQAERMFLEMTDRFQIVPGVTAYTAFMGVQKNREGCDKVLEAMVDAGLKPSETTFRVMWSVTIGCGDLNGGLGVIDKMREFGLVPHVSFYNKLIVAFGNKRDLVKVEALVEAMSKAGMKPSVVTYNALMDAFGKTLRSPVAAEQLMKDMLTAGVEPDLITFNTLAAVYARAADPDGVDKVLDRMKERGLEPDKFTKSSVIVANRRAGRIAEAQAASEGAKKEGFLL